MLVLPAVTDTNAFQLIAAPYREVQPDVQVGHYISTQDYFAKNKETLAKYNRAFRKGVQWYNANLKDPDLVRIISGFTKMQPDLVAKLDLQRLPEVVNLGSVATTVKLMKDNGLITGDIDLAAMTDPDALK